MATSLNKCTGCGDRFPPGDLISVPAGKFHSWECATQYATDKKNKPKIKKIADKVAKKDIKKRKEALRGLPWYKKEAQKWFNKFIRLRDHQLNCISCGRKLAEKYGGAYDAGHYRTVGANPEMRFNEDNCHAQCVYCNRNLSGNVTNYRIGLVHRIGIKRLDLLEGYHAPAKYTIDDLKEIIATYKAKCKELEQCN